MGIIITVTRPRVLPVPIAFVTILSVTSGAEQTDRPVATHADPARRRRFALTWILVTIAALVLTALACLAALAISIYPGVLDELLVIGFFLSILAFPIVGGGALVALIVLAAKGKLRRVPIPWREVALALILLNVTYALLRFYIPRRIAFALSRSSFASLVATAPSSEYRGVPLNRWLGVYRVDEYAADPRGGVYFRVFTGSDGLGPDQMSYGFAYQPNNESTPFGAAHYRTFRLGDGWYWFRASDDWH